MTITEHKAELLTAASALALYDGATTTADKVRAAAAMAHVLRTIPAAPATKASRKPAAANSDVLNVQNLTAALKRVCAVVERRCSVPVLANVMLRASGGALHLTGTDLDMVYEETLTDAAELGDLATTVNAHELLSVLNGCKGGVGMALDVGKITVIAGGTTNSFRTMPVGDFPIMEFEEPQRVLSMPVSDFIAPLSFVSSAISTEETRYYLNGAFLHLATDSDLPNGKELRFVTTDGHRLLLAPVNSEPLAEFEGKIIPRKVVGWLIKHLPAGEVLGVEVSKNGHLRFTTPRGVLTAKMIDGAYPDYPRVIPRLDGKGERERVAHFDDTRSASEVIARLAKISREKSRSVVLSATGGKLSGRVKNMDGGRSEAEIPGVSLATSHLPIEIGFNSGYVLDALSLGETASLFLTEPNAPIRIEWPDKPGCVGVLMPLRV